MLVQVELYVHPRCPTTVPTTCEVDPNRPEGVDPVGSGKDVGVMDWPGSDGEC
jgi:hypothetical protein